MRGEFVRVGAQQFQPLGGAVIDHQHIAHDVLRDARRDGQRRAARRPRRCARTSTSSLMP